MGLTMNRSEFVQQADHLAGLPDDQEGGYASDNMQDPEDGPATEMLVSHEPVKRIT
jgi:hypothetical protein